MSRVVSWDGGFNVVDLGGLPLIGGGETAFGRVFRSGAPEWLTDAGLADAAAAGIRCFIDLRNHPEETSRRPHHPRVSDAALEPFEIVHAPTESMRHPRYEEFLTADPRTPAGWAVNLEMTPNLVAGAFSALATSRVPVLFHCAAGRDRTGMIATVLLSLTGVEPRAIVDDWEQAARRVNAHALAHPRPTREAPFPDPAAFDAHVAVGREAVERWVDALDAAALLARICVPDQHVARLASILR